MGYDPSEKPPMYVLTKEGLKTQEEIEQAAQKPASKYLFGSPWLSFSLFLALLTYFLNGSEWMKSAERYLDKRQQEMGIKPYRLWAEKHPMSYGDVAAGPSVYIGKAVLWEIQFGAEGAMFCEGDPNKKVVWSGRPPVKTGTAVKVLARIEGASGDLPLLLLLD